MRIRILPQMTLPVEIARNLASVIKHSTVAPLVCLLLTVLSLPVLLFSLYLEVGLEFALVLLLVSHSF